MAAIANPTESPIFQHPVNCVHKTTPGIPINPAIPPNKYAVRICPKT